MTATLADIAAHLDERLRVAEFPDYPGALNGIQVEHRGPVVRIASAVDLSLRTIRDTIDVGANLLMVHHGLFWGGLRPFRGPHYERVRLLMHHDVAVYASHLPLDADPELGNNVLLARELELEPARGFARYKDVAIGVRGTADIPTNVLANRLQQFASRYGGTLRTTPLDSDRRTRSWAICTGAGASAETLAEAAIEGIDTLIVGEGPHWTAVDADELNIAILYAGHYATETLGIQRLAAYTADRFSVPWSFVHAPTGL